MYVELTSSHDHTTSCIRPVAHFPFVRRVRYNNHSTRLEGVLGPSTQLAEAKSAMLAFRRLDQVLESSMEIPFTNKSKIVFMSDCHRGDGSAADDFAANKQLYMHALRQYYTAGYTYIEIGDGDELWENSRFDKIVSTHKDVFQLLRRFHRSGRLYMIYGNHDIVKRQKPVRMRHLYYAYDRTKRSKVPLLEGLLAHEGLILKHIPTGTRLFVTHGHQADFFNDQLWVASCILVRYVWRFLEVLGIQDPVSPAKNHNKRNRIERVLVRWAKANNQILIAGHTHRPTFPQVGDAPYLNDGSCVHRGCITAIEIKHGMIALVRWCEKPTQSGSPLYLREVIGGPRPLLNVVTDKTKPLHLAGV